jgi:hypothetical protein
MDSGAHHLTASLGPTYGPRQMRPWLVVGVIIGVFVGARPQGASADAGEVERLIAKANELRQQGNPWQALSYYQKAYEIEHTPRTEGQLGVGELAAGYPVEAADHIAISLRSPKHPWVEKYKSVLEETLAKARARIGDLAIEGKLEGATVTINGHEIGKLPLASNVNVAAGSVEIVVHSDGYADFKRTIEVPGGGHEHVVVNLVRDAAAHAVSPPAQEAVSTSSNIAAESSAATTVAAEHPAEPRTSLRLTGFITGGVAVAALGAGGALQWLATKRIHDFNASCSIGGQGPISKSTMMASGQCSTAYDSSSNEKKWSTIAYVAGGALAITSGILIWWSYRGDGERMPEQHARIGCVPGPTGVACGGVF